MGLFREEVLEKQKNKLTGDVIISRPVSFSIIILFIFVSISVLFLFLLNGEYSRKETVTGYVYPENGLVKISNKRDGIAIEILVSKGQEVKVGESLIVISSDTYTKEGYSVSNLLLEDLGRQFDLIQKKIDISSEVSLQKINKLVMRQHSMSQDIENVKKSVPILEKKKTIIDRQLIDARELLAEEFTGKRFVNNIELNLFEIESQIHEKNSQLVSLINTQKSLELEINDININQSKVSAQLDLDLEYIIQIVHKVESDKEQIIKASRDGVIGGMQVKVGQEVSIGEPLLTILPINSELIVDLLVPIRAIGFVEKGQSLKVRYTAFSYQKFGLYEAKIVDVGGVVFLPSELKSLPVQVLEPVYKVKALLNRQDIDAFGQSVDLKSGFTLEADITLSKRSLLEWLMEPLISLKGRI
ncbi:MAG: HlyD family efflux transporter periplasmic adaptor subunit [Saccharospirillaceae bacterium]|nr:HlyD family efflux transporter periplasmic adaptor subunit [Saccharospirillaceae bacterium]